MAGLLIRSSILDGSATLIRSRGGRPAAVARRAGLPRRALTDPDLLVSGAAVSRFFEFAAQACGDRTWGLSLSANARLAAIIGPLWILLRNARTVGQMCEAFAHNFDVFSDVAVVTARPQEDGGLLLSWSMATPSVNSNVQMLEFALSVLAREVRTHLGSGWVTADVLFGHDREDPDTRPKAAPQLQKATLRQYWQKLAWKYHYQCLAQSFALLTTSKTSYPLPRSTSQQSKT